MSAIPTTRPAALAVAGAGSIARQREVAAGQQPAVAASALWLHLHLPFLPLEVLLRGLAPGRACVLVQGEGSRRRVCMVNTRAATLGVRSGMPLDAAHALGDLVEFERNESTEQQALTSLGLWAMQFTPVVSRVPPDGLLLEIKGSLRLFHGLDGLLARLRQGLKQLGYRVQYAVAATPLAATLLARSSARTIVLDMHELKRALAELPVESLRLSVAQQEAFASIGVRNLGECRRLARSDLARRLSPAVVELLDRAYGQLADPRVAMPMTRVFDAALELPWEVRQAPALVIAGERLLHELIGYLRAHGAMTRQLRWSLRDRNQQRERFEIRLTRAGREYEQMALLLREMLMRMQLKAPICAIRLEVDDLVYGSPTTATDLFGGRPQATDEAYAAFADRLRSRCGEQALRSVALQPDRRPELAWCWRHGDSRSRQALVKSAAPADASMRPLWLVKEPVTLPTRRGLPQFDGPLQLVAERERIDTGWWDGNAMARDYFIATTTRGSRLWVYKELDGERRWRLHGVFE